MYIRVNLSGVISALSLKWQSLLRCGVPVLLLIPGLLSVSCTGDRAELPPPNILWLTSEDNSPMLGCYGDTFATTPNLDALAARGFLYTHAYSNAPVCAPSRNTIITGVYANSGGHEHMRSFYRKSDDVRLYPEFLRKAGYYCTNNSKEDFNIDPTQTKDVWDALGREAHYKNRPSGKPFFAIFNATISHESSIHKSIPSEELRHKPEDVVLPPYHPDTEEFRHDWAQYYDKVEDMDTWVGTKLRELEELGEAENTIVFYYSDHGGILGRSKRFVYESGTHVPFIVHIPEKYKHLYPVKEPGSRVDRLISLVDLGPTLMSIIGESIPSFFQGQAFLGEQKSDDPEYVFMFRGRMDERYDMSRAVRDRRYRYIRNYMPHREYAQFIDYLWRAPSMRSWEAAFRAGECNDVQSIFWNSKPAEELYDTENDPWEVKNLATDPNYKEVLERMRKASRDWSLRIRDVGFLAEAEVIERVGEGAPYDYMRNADVDLAGLISAAETCSSPSDVAQIVEYLRSDDSGIRFWGATGLLVLGEKARPAMADLRKALYDSAPDVAVTAAEALYRLGDKAVARKSIYAILQSPNSFARTRAINTIDILDESTPEAKAAVISMVRGLSERSNQDYDWRAARSLLTKWKIDPKDVGIDFSSN